MQLQDFPFELLLQVLSSLNYEDILSFVQCNSALYSRSMSDSFWFDLCRLHGIHYRHPELSWRELYQSNELAKMCPHLSESLLDVIPEKKQLLWTTRSLSNAGNDMLCLHPSCTYFGTVKSYSTHSIYCLHFLLGDAKEYDAYHCRFHHQGTRHAIVLRLSPLHTLELWCNSCVKAVGYLYSYQIRCNSHFSYTSLNALVGWLWRLCYPCESRLKNRALLYEETCARDCNIWSNWR